MGVIAQFPKTTFQEIVYEGGQKQAIPAILLTKRESPCVLRHFSRFRRWLFPWDENSHLSPASYTNGETQFSILGGPIHPSWQGTKFVSTQIPAHNCTGSRCTDDISPQTDHWYFKALPRKRTWLNNAVSWYKAVHNKQKYADLGNFDWKHSYSLQSGRSRGSSYFKAGLDALPKTTITLSDEFEKLAITALFPVQPDVQMDLMLQIAAKWSCDAHWYSLYVYKDPSFDKVCDNRQLFRCVQVYGIETVPAFQHSTYSMQQWQEDKAATVNRFFLLTRHCAPIQKQKKDSSTFGAISFELLQKSHSYCEALSRCTNLAQCVGALIDHRNLLNNNAPELITPFVDPAKKRAPAPS